MLLQTPLLEVTGLKKCFPVHGGIFKRRVGTFCAVDDVSFTVDCGETLGVVGESGSGKSTLARTLLRLYEPEGGSVLFEGKNVFELPPRELLRIRQHMQMIFQDPYSSLNPRMTAGEIIREPLDVFGRGSPAERECEVRLVLARVGLSPEALQRYPHEFSGGQRQRIGIARAVILRPQLIVADEAVSALDVSVQAQIVNLMMELRRELGLAFIFISHDLSLVRHVSDRIAIMYLGRIVEMSSREEVFTRPAHPYTQALLASMPQPVVPVTRKRAVLQGEPPAATHLLQGCRFYSRCRRATERCQRETPSLTDVSAGGGVRHEAACFHPGA